MKRKVISLLFAVFVVFSLLPNVSRADIQNTNITSYRTSYNDSNYFEFSVNGDNLTISGKSSDSGIKYLWIKLGELDQGQFRINTNESFKKTYSISSLKSDAQVSITIYTNDDLYGTYNSIFWGSDVTMKYFGSSWRFNFNQSVLSRNHEIESQWTNPGDALYSYYKVDSTVTALSESITAGAKNDYEKLQMIHNWVADKIYYDYDYFYGRTKTVSIDPYEVLKTKRAVCSGYARLTQLLATAQNIPCIYVTGYALDSSTSGEWTDETANASTINHAWNEAWADGRWVIIDTTWDSGNRYENADFFYNGVRNQKFFDISNEQFSQDHRTQFRLATLRKSIPSQWAQDEISKAISTYLVPYSLQSSYANNISRSEFCSLIVKLIEAKRNTTISQFLADKGLITDTSTFSDCNDLNVLSAYVLGIVIGKGNGIFDPNGAITRQEAAVMLSRAAKVLGLKSSGVQTISFTDSGSFASWSTDAIAFISSLADKSSGKLVMGGIGGGQFSPNTTYMREQSYCSIIRFYNSF